MPLIFLKEDTLIKINKKIEEKADNIEILYIHREVPVEAVKNISHLVVCATHFFNYTNDILLTATYYLKNIIVLQGFEDANHRTAIISTKTFLEDNGYETKEVEPECFILFRDNLLSYRMYEYFTLDSFTNRDFLKFNDSTENTIENIVFAYCFKFIENKLLI